MEISNKFRNIIKFLFPSTAQEGLLLLIAFIGYGILASVIALDYRIVYDERIPWDAYFSFDNRSIINTGGGVERHPLSKYWFDAIRETALKISHNERNDIFRLIISLFSSIAIALSLVQIFKYLRNIITLPSWLCWLLVLFFGIFSTNILLSFTPETYTYTLLFLCTFNHYAASKLKHNGKISPIALTLGVVSIGGMTITNAVKPLIPILVERKLFGSMRSIFNAIWRSFLAVMIFLLLFLYRIDFNFNAIISKAGEQYEKFSQPKQIPLWDMIYSWFFGGNVLFSNFLVRDYHNKKGYHYAALFMDTYDTVALYVTIGVLFMMVGWAIIQNWNNKLLLILVASFLVDIMIHCIMKFGLHTAYIYGGHFVFVIPLMLGWLFHSLKNKPLLFTFALGVFILIFVFTIGNNFFRMTEFFEFMNQYYRQ